LEILDETKIDLKKLGAQVRFLRQGKSWSLNDLAEKSGVSKAYISDLENAEAGKPNIQYVYKIAVALDTTIDRLLNESKAVTTKPRGKEKLEELPPGLAEAQQELDLTDAEAEMLAQLNFRGHRPRDKEGWRFLWEAIKMAGRPPQN
jgi:transcriptional regulator with XRE-family HTH domain